jgi:hypothetical protein
MKEFMKKYWLVCGLVCVALVIGACQMVSSLNEEKDRAALQSKFHSIEREDIDIVSAKNWDKNKDRDLSEEEIEKLLFFLNNMPSEKIQVGDGAVGTGRFSLYFMTKDKEEFLLKYDNERIYIIFDSDSAEKYGKRNWEIRDSQLVDYCVESLFSE